MCRLFRFLLLCLGLLSAPVTGQPLTDGPRVHLDAESLAEQGIGEAYDRIRPTLAKYVRTPWLIEEQIDRVRAAYRVQAGGTRFVVYAPEVPDSDADSWGRATYILFHIVNAQLVDAPVRFYAINGGNDLGGVFLTPAQAEAARADLPNRTDWPYMPTLDAPWFGQHHD